MSNLHLFAEILPLVKLLLPKSILCLMKTAKMLTMI